MSSPDPAEPADPVAPAPTEHACEPRDSRVDAFLRQAEGILAAQRQWSAQTQIKLKSLAKELNLPPDLFQTALEQLADPSRHAPPTRWEQAFCEYLEKQLQQLSGDILPLPKERKALSYGRQKFQLSPDACERCLAKIAKQMRIARISDAQAMAYAQQEIARLVSHHALPAEQLREQVLQLAQRCGVQEKTAERLLSQELTSRRRKRRRIWLRQVSLTVGTAVLSVSLILAIVALGRVLTPPTPDLQWVAEPTETSPPKTDPTEASNSPPWVGPTWWTEKQRAFADHWIERGQPVDLLISLTDPAGDRRATAYRQLLLRLADLDQQLCLIPNGPPRWWRQPHVQEMLLECYWQEPDLSAARAIIDGLYEQRGSSSEAGLALQPASPIADPTANVSSAAASERPPSAMIAATRVLGRFLTARAAETILLRAYQQGWAASQPNPAPPYFADKQNLLTRGQPALRGVADADQLSILNGQIRSKWLAESAESLYLQLQAHWPTPPYAATATELAAWREVVTAAADTFRQLPQPNQRHAAMLVYWSGVVGLDGEASVWAWADLADHWEQIPTWNYRPLIDSWYVSPPDSAWGRHLETHWQRLASENQLEWTGDRAMDAIRLQVLLGTPPLPSPFQWALRRAAIRRQIDTWLATTHDEGRSATLADWQRLMRLVTLAQAAVTCTDSAAGDRSALQLAALDRLLSARSSTRLTNQGNAPNNDALPGIHLVEPTTSTELWQRLVQTADVPNYRELASQWVQQLPPDARLAWQPAQRLVQYLRAPRSATEQAAWVLAWQGGNTGQGSNARSALDAMLEFPTLALALSDALTDTATGDPVAGLAWLGCPTDVAAPTLVARWRQRALEQLQQMDREQRLTLPVQLWDSYQEEFTLRAAWTPNTFSRSVPTAWSTNDPLLAALVVQDAWREATVVAGDTAAAEAWNADRAVIEHLVSPLTALWTAEHLALQRLATELRAADSLGVTPETP